MIFLKKILPRINHLFCTFIESYKKKMEEQADLRRQLKLLESKNTTLMQSNIDLEEDIKKAGNWKPQMDKYKKQITEVQDKMDAETKRADKSEFETKKLLERLEAISVERDRLQSERDDLKERYNEANDQLKGKKNMPKKDRTSSLILFLHFSL